MFHARLSAFEPDAVQSSPEIIFFLDVNFTTPIRALCIIARSFYHAQISPLNVIALQL